MNTLKIIGLLVGLGWVGLAGNAAAQLPDCSAEGPDRLGLVWEDNSFTMYPHNYLPHNATLYLFNPTIEYITGWELRLDYNQSGITVLSTTLRGSALNVGSNGDFIVGLVEPLLPDASGVVALADFTIQSNSSGVEDVIANPVANSSPSLPGQMSYLAPGYGASDTLVTIIPIGGFDQPIGNIDDLMGIELPYCPQPNQAPSTGWDLVTTDEDVAFTFDILANDHDPDGSLDYSSVILIGSPTMGGNFTYNGDGTITYTPPPETSGTDFLNYTVADNEGAVSAQTAIMVTVNNVNDAPVANPDSAVTSLNQSVIIDLLANDTDVDSVLDPASLVLVDPSGILSLTDHGDGTITFSPATGYTGEVFFGYTIADTEGTVSNQTSVNVMVNPVWTDVSATSGINVDQGGRSTAWGDYDGDGDEDLFIAQTSDASRLYSNNGDGTFTDVTDSETRIGGDLRPVVWGDPDNDGDLDLFAGKSTRSNPTDNILLWNDGLGGFTQSSELPLGSREPCHGFNWVDYNLDGKLDGFLGSGTGIGDFLLRNLDGTTFLDVTPATFKENPGAFTSCWADYDLDGDMDVYLATPGLNNSRLMRNDGYGVFTDVTTPVLRPNINSRGAAWGDYDNDGDPDLYLAGGNYPNHLVRNDGGGVFTDVTPTLLADPDITMGMVWLDFNNDMNLDLYIINQGTANILAINNGDGTWTEGDFPALQLADESIAASAADYDQDGDLDLYLTTGIHNMPSTHLPGHLLRNDQATGNHWLQVGLVGTHCNRQAVGARIEVLAGGVRQTRWIPAGDGFWNQNQQVQCFGLGSATTVDSVIVTWPSINNLGQHHRTWVSPVTVDQQLLMTEPTDISFELEHPPVVAFIEDQVVNDDENFLAINLDQHIWTDNETAPVNWSYSGNTSMQVSLTGAIATVFHPLDWGGVETITFTAEVNGLLGSQDVTFTVLNPDVDWTDVTVVSGMDAITGGAGISWGDYDNDADYDLFVTQTTQGTRLMRNEGDGTFLDVTTPEVAANADSRSAVWSDPDNDGDLDLYVTFSVYGGYTDNFMSWNNGDGTFSKSYFAPLSIPGSTSESNWLDYDQDGLQDVFLARGATGHSLFRNIDGTTFEDVTLPPLDDPSGASTSCWADYDLDGDMDLFTASHNGSAKLFRYDGGNTFTDVTQSVMAPDYTLNGAGWGDYDNDGDPDLYLVRATNPTLPTNILLNNDGGVFTDVTPALLANSDPGEGMVWLDYDNDGDLDLYLLNERAPNRLFRNDITGWSDQTPRELLDSENPSLATAFADYDQDGDLDLFVSTSEYPHPGHHGPNLLLRNELDTGNLWLQIDLIGTYSNRLAAGAKVEVFTGSVTQTRWVPAGSGGHNQNQHALAFGLGEADVDSVRVTWPRKLINGDYRMTTLTGVTTDQVLTITEPNAAPAIADLGAISIPHGALSWEVDLSALVTDEQPADELLWSVSGDDDILVNFAWGNAYITLPDPAWFGTNILTITATDNGGLTGSSTLIFTVETGFDLYVEIMPNGEDGYFAATATGATDGFDPTFESIIDTGPPSVLLDSHGITEGHAFIRHLWAAQANETTAVRVNEEDFRIAYDRYQAIPPGDLYLWVCPGGNCDWSLLTNVEPGVFYSLVWVDDGEPHLEIIEDTGQVWPLADARPLYDPLNEAMDWKFEYQFTNPGASPVTSAIQFDPSFLPTDGINLKLWDSTDEVLFDLWPTMTYTYEVPAATTDDRAFFLYIGTPGTTGDTDGDGVADVDDACPGEDASFFDRDGDGCIDPVIGARHIEYWDQSAFPLEYVIHEGGVPEITDGSDTTAVIEGFQAWEEIANTEISINYLGTTSDPVAHYRDGINTVTFSDDEYDFDNGVIAVGLSTSYLEADHANGIRPGQIIDTDMIFNPSMDLRTDTQGPADGTHIKSVVVHEAGHMLGLAHSGVQSSTMFYVLPPDTTGVSLEMDDRLSMYKAYYDSTSYLGTSHLRGTVTDGWTGLPVSGAIVYAISVATGDTAACDFTLPADGSYHFIGLPDDSYTLAIHPLDGSPAIGYLNPFNINQLINGTADILFVPEFWDSAESSSDNAADSSPVLVSAGATTIANFVTNIDLIPPAIIAVSPGPLATDVPIDSAILFRCDEPIDPGSLVGNFNFSAAGGDFLLGNAQLLENGHTLAYTPTLTLDFETQYILEVGAGIKDLYGNEMGFPFTTTFTTGIQPPVAVTNLVPTSGLAGMSLVIYGAGFNEGLEDNNVTFGTTSWDVTSAGPSQLVVQIPDDATPGTANIQVETQGNLSNELSFTVLTPGGEARGLPIAAVDLYSLPREVEITPDGTQVFIATEQGLSLVDVSDPTAPVHDAHFMDNGLTGIDITPDGQSLYAISSSEGMLYRLGTDPVIELESLELDYRPLGIVIGPSGRRAYVATNHNEIQVFDIDPLSSNFHNPVGALLTPDPNLLGAMAVDPLGNLLLALDGSGRLLVFDLNTFDPPTEVPVLSAARDVVIDPGGSRAFVSDDNGYVSMVSLTNLVNLIDIPTGGSLLGAAVDPRGSFLYAVNHQMDNLDVIDLRPNSSTYRGISTRLPQQTNPVDVALSPDGVYAYCIVESDQRLVINAVGSGPLLASLSPRSGPIGTQVVLTGSDFTGGSVSFGGFPGVIQTLDDTSITTTVPAGATSSQVMVLGNDPGEVSNGLGFLVLDESPPGNLHLTAALQPVGTPSLTGAFTTIPNDQLVAIGGLNGIIHLLDVDPTSLDFNLFVRETPALAGPIDDLVAAPDGLSVFAVTSGTAAVARFNTNPGSESFGELLYSIDLDQISPDLLCLSPDGRILVVSETSGNTVLAVNLSSNIASTIALGSPVQQFVFHPAGLLAYVALANEIQVLDMDPTGGNFGGLIGSLAAIDNPNSLEFSADGNSCLMLAGTTDRYLVTLDSTDPATPQLFDSLLIQSGLAAQDDHLVISPAGDRVLVGMANEGLFLVDLADEVVHPQTDAIALGAPFEFGFTADGQRVLAASSDDDMVSTYDFNSTQQLELVWGDQQTGETNGLLDSSLRVRVIDLVTGEGLASVPVTFSIDTSGEGFNQASASPVKAPKLPSTDLLKGAHHDGLNKGIPDGYLVTDDPDARPTTLTTGTNAFGFAEVNWSLGMTAGTQAVEVSTLGAAGSPFLISANAVEDPASVDFALVPGRFAPSAGTADVSISTAIQVAFTQSVDPQTVTENNYYLSDDGGATALPSLMGFASANTTVSLSPDAVLHYDTTYTVVIGTGVFSQDGEALTNSQTFTFNTGSAPPVPVIQGVSPPSGAELATVTITGSGFSPDPDLNNVYFGGTAGPVLSSEPGFIITRVPLELGTGLIDVWVDAAGQLSNSQEFQVLAPAQGGADEVVVRVPTSSPVKSATVSPDGALVYSIAPEADLVLPIDLVNFTTLSSIPVGDMPWAIASHPDGELVYVANRVSGDLSVINTKVGSDTYHQTIQSIPVGNLPADILITPTGDRVLVANEESQDLSVIDSNSESASFNSVVNRVPVASSAKSVTVTPDGARIYVGTDGGYVVIGSVDYGVVNRVPVASSVKTVTVSPDGALLVVLDTGGMVSIFNITEGSANEDRVVARVPVGSSVKTVTVSPDGALLYAVMEEDDLINVYSLEIEPSVGVIGAPDGRPIPELVLLDTLVAGENPQEVIFDPTGSGKFIVPNAGDNSISVFDWPGEGELAGQVVAQCPEPQTLVPGVEIDVYANATGELIDTLMTDENGCFTTILPAGEYTLTMLTPIGFILENEEQILTVEGGQTVDSIWDLECQEISPNQRRMAWWKRQFAVALRGHGHSQIDGPTLCAYLDGIADHFNSNMLNQVVIYQPPESGECEDKLMVAKGLLNFWGNWGTEARAKQQLLTLLLNVAGYRISLQHIISEDGANVSQAITYCDNLIDDDNPDNDWLAWRIAFRVNVGQILGTGTIPNTTPNIFYSPVATHFHLDQNYPNPFNPECRIRFGVPQPGRIQLKIFDIKGRLVNTLVDESLQVGTYIKVWDGTDNRGQPVASGVYFYRMQADSFVRTRKMLLMK